MPTLILSMPTNVGRLPGITSFSSICNFVAPIERNSRILFLSVARKPPSIVIIATITLIKTAIKTMALLPLPNQTMIIGPSAILGKLFNTTMYGSKIFLALSDHQRASAMVYPTITAMANPKIVSYKVTPIWNARLSCKNKSFIVKAMREGELLIKASIISNCAANSQNTIINRIIIILIDVIKTASFFILLIYARCSLEKSFLFIGLILSIFFRNIFRTRGTLFF